MNLYSSHAAGRAAYTRGSTPSQGSTQSTPSADDTENAESPSEPQDTALQKTGQSDLTTQERQMIEENFPEDPELSMRLYGRGRDAKTVSSNTVGENLDVTG
jgi:hypothetical protein